MTLQANGQVTNQAKKAEITPFFELGIPSTLLVRRAF